MTLFTHRNAEMQLDKEHTALVLVDMQNEFLSENGCYYQMIAERLESDNVHDHSASWPMRYGPPKRP
jgi:hypothetical protein